MQVEENKISASPLSNILQKYKPDGPKLYMFYQECYNRIS
jgi:hypothetical protein